MDISPAWHKEENGVGGRLVMGLAFSLGEVTWSIVELSGGTCRKYLGEVNRRVEATGGAHGMPSHLGL